MTIYEGRTQITSPFGPRRHPIYGTQTQHRGKDEVGLDSKEQRFVNKHNLDGVVKEVGYDKWRGKYVLIDIIGDPRGKVDVRYQHISAAKVSKGQRVKVGDIVAIEGSTGDSTGSHCHYEVRVNGVAIDPSGDDGLPNKVGVYQGNDSGANNTENKGDEDLKIGVYGKTDEPVRSSAMKDGAIALMDADGNLALYRRRISREVDDNTLSSKYEDLRYNEMQPGEIIAVTEN